MNFFDRRMKDANFTNWREERKAWGVQTAKNAKDTKKGLKTGANGGNRGERRKGSVKPQDTRNTQNEDRDQETLDSERPPEHRETRGKAFRGFPCGGRMANFGA
jgi:hypothetical protein